MKNCDGRSARPIGWFTRHENYTTGNTSGSGEKYRELTVQRCAAHLQGGSAQFPINFVLHFVMCRPIRHLVLIG
jgi:hypothetical protein